MIAEAVKKMVKGCGYIPTWSTKLKEDLNKNKK